MSNNTHLNIARDILSLDHTKQIPKHIRDALDKVVQLTWKAGTQLTSRQMVASVIWYANQIKVLDENITAEIDELKSLLGV